MSEKIKLAFCVHSHQPVGNYASVFEQGTRECYLPFLRILKQYPEMRMTLHYTGPLLEWFEGHAPEFFDKAVFSTLVGTLRAEGYISDSGDAIQEQTREIYIMLSDLMTPDIKLTIESAGMPSELPQPTEPPAEPKMDVRDTDH